ncbi:MAG: thermonuclease family protein [Alphaproteobacteria bacterium]|nr:thermonuclease family protein [Alphaproteobacteria bacterium]
MPNWLRASGLVLLLLTTCGAAQERPFGPVDCFVIKVVDGDTVLAHCYPWPHVVFRTYVRVAAVDAPEMQGRCEAEEKAAAAARRFVQEQLGPRRAITIEDIRPGKYAQRVIATVRTGPGPHLGRMLVQAGHARVYDGGKRQSWCPRQQSLSTP